MKNKVYRTTGSELPMLRRQLSAVPGLWVGELDGNEIPDLDAFLKTVSSLMDFPTISKSLGSYLDWITDLDWLHANGYALIIKNFSNFMDQDSELKNHVIHLFFKSILPWWEEEVKHCVVGGKPKPFNVYLID